MPFVMERIFSNQSTPSKVIKEQPFKCKMVSTYIETETFLNSIN